MLQEFKEFVSRGNLIELAVAVILGLAFAAVVSTFTEDNHAFPKEDEAAGPTELELLTQIRDELRLR